MSSQQTSQWEAPESVVQKLLRWLFEVTPFILKRMLYGLVTLVLVVVIITSIIYIAPVDPARLTKGQRTDAASIELTRKKFGLDKPLPLQILSYINDVSPISFHNTSSDFKEKYQPLLSIPFGGTALAIKAPYLRDSYQRSGRRVIDILKEAIPKTLLLAVTSIFIASIIGIFLGVIASLKQNSWFDNLAVSLSVFGYSLPSYVSASILAIVFGFYLAHITGLNIQGDLYGYNDYTGEDYIVWKNLFLPALALGIRPVAIITQLTRSAMLDILSQDYIRTARAKGLKKFTIVFKHALRNALNPIVTAISGWFAALLAGAFFVEAVFNFKGLGWELINALMNYDRPLLLGAVLFAAVVFVLMNIIVDILYAIIDPQVSVGK